MFSIIGSIDIVLMVLPQLVIISSSPALDGKDTIAALICLLAANFVRLNVLNLVVVSSLEKLESPYQTAERRQKDIENLTKHLTQIQDG